MTWLNYYFSLSLFFFPVVSLFGSQLTFEPIRCFFGFVSNLHNHFIHHHRPFDIIYEMSESNEQGGVYTNEWPVGCPFYVFRNEISSVQMPFQRRKYYLFAHDIEFTRYILQIRNLKHSRNHSNGSIRGSIISLTNPSNQSFLHN